MEKLRCALIEDEPDNRMNLALMLKNYCPQVEVIAEAGSVAEGVKVIKETNPDLVFLDVELGDGTGFDLLPQLGNIEVNIIFATAFTHYAIKAIRFNAVDYITKPIDIHELITAVNKVVRKSEAGENMLKIKNLISNMGIQDPGSKRIALVSMDAIKMVELRNIIRLEGENNYTKFHIKGEAPVLVSKTIKEYESMLSEHNFFRTHQSHMVNLACVSTYIKGDGGYLEMTDGSTVTVSRHRKQDLLEFLQKK